MNQQKDFWETPKPPVVSGEVVPTCAPSSDRQLGLTRDEFIATQLFEEIQAFVDLGLLHNWYESVARPFTKSFPPDLAEVVRDWYDGRVWFLKNEEKQKCSQK